MKNESIARRLRIRHGISVSALAHAAGISKSRLVFMEGEESPRTEYQRQMLQRAYENLIAERRNALDRLEHVPGNDAPCFCDAYKAHDCLGTGRTNRWFHAAWSS